MAHRAWRAPRRHLIFGKGGRFVEFFKPPVCALKNDEASWGGSALRNANALVLVLTV